MKKVIFEEKLWMKAPEFIYLKFEHDVLFKTTRKLVNNLEWPPIAIGAWYSHEFKIWVPNFEPNLWATHYFQIFSLVGEKLSFAFFVLILAGYGNSDWRDTKNKKEVLCL